ncbi:MAG: TIGR03915 family putative DNA repair protein [Prolixibacteraceae bacterium]|nr:TIGR03915 family putative DNA repair protein [Prolixibacteraceae bacterium]
MIQIFTYNNTFEGFLTVVFECYKRGAYPVDIRSKNRLQRNIFGEYVYIESDPSKAERVWKGLRERMPGKNHDLPFYAFLSEDDGIEMKIFRFIKRIFSGQFDADTDFSDPDVSFLNQVAKKVKFEGMRMLQFVRFQRTKEDLYFCGIEPRYDVIPLAINHYKRRFVNQKWIIYDLKRDYGIFYDLNETQEIVLTQKRFNELNGAVQDNLLEEGEAFYQQLWKTYFKNVNIAERKNLRLQRQHLPQRFWKYLTEMQL